MSKTNNLEIKLKEIIERKHLELNLGRDYSEIFSKIRDFEGNAIGQIGEEFAKEVIKQVTTIVDEGIIHTEYDVQTETGILFEVKTARKGRNGNTFQFNGINPNYNYSYLLCLGICEDAILYRIFDKKDISYIHKTKNFFVKQGEISKQLVQMNPNNLVNYKLTLNLKELFEASTLIPYLESILNK